MSESENPILVIDQISVRFATAMFENFCEIAPVGSNPKRYRGRTLRPVRAKIESVDANCQKFRSSVRFICACKPAGFTENHVLSAPIARHLVKRTTMSYDAKGFPHERWQNDLAFKFFVKVPTFAESNTEAPLMHRSRLQHRYHV